MRVHSATLILLIGLGACTVGPDYQRPPDNVPGSFSEDGAGTIPIALTSPWWLAFHDPVLNEVIDRAQANSPTVMQAQAAVQEARAAVEQARNGTLPTLGMTASGERARSYTPPNFYSPTYTYGTVGFDSSWEIDLWGKGRRSVEAAKANADQAEASADDAKLTLLGDVAHQYSILRGAQAQLAATRIAIADQRRNADMVAARAHVGDGTGLDVAQAQTELAQTEAEIPVLVTSIHVAEHALSILCGASPGELFALLDTPAPVPAAGTPGASVPADLLRRRPDVRAAERLLAANTAQVGAAVAGRLPSLSLSGSLSFSSTSIASLLVTPLFAVGPAIHAPILDGKGAAAVDVARARVDEARFAYRNAVLRALEDVEDAIARLRGDQAHRARLADTLATAGRGAALAQTAFRIGAIDLVTMITAQRSVDNARIALAQADEAVMTDTVALFKALGGGYQAASG